MNRSMSTLTSMHASLPARLHASLPARLHASLPARLLSRTLALALALGVGLQPALLPLAAAGDLEQVCEALVAPDGSPETEFMRNVRMYVGAYERRQSLQRALFTSRIKNTLFENVQTGGYVEGLRYIDAQSTSHPEAIYDLAKSLQLHWEARYAMGMGLKRTERARTATKAGTVVGIVGLAASGILLFFRPSAAPKYFRIWRHLMPLAGAAAGYGTGRALHELGWLDEDTPLAPAHVMRLGINTDDYHYDDDTLVRDIVSLTAGVAATSMAISAYRYIRTGVKAVKYVNAAATPAKVHPLVLVGSIILGLIVEEGVEAAVDHYEHKGYKDRFTAQRDCMLQAYVNGEDERIYSCADGLVRTAMNLASYYNRSINEAIQEYAGDVAEAAEDYGEGTPRFQEKLDKLTRELSDDIREALDDRAFRIDLSYEGYLVRGFLKNRDEAAIDELGQRGRDLAAAYQRSFERWLSHRENEDRQSFADNQRNELFRYYMDQLDRAADERVAGTLRAGAIPFHANHMLLQAAALIRSLDKPYLEDQAEFLMSTIARMNLLTGTTLGDQLHGGSGGMP